MEKEVENLEKKRQHAIDVANKLEKAASGTPSPAGDSCRLFHLSLFREIVKHRGTLSVFGTRTGKKGDQKKSKQVAKVRKEVLRMGFKQNADGQSLSKKKISEAGDRAGSILSKFGKQSNQMGQVRSDG